MRLQKLIRYWKIQLFFIIFIKMQDTLNNTDEINEKQQNLNHEELDLDNKDETILHKKRKRRHRKRRHSPQYYQQIRMTQLNNKREMKWNTRFVHQTIPELEEDARFRKRMLSVKKTTIHKKQKLSKHPSRVYSTAKDQPGKSNTNKSFHIRVISKKQKSIAVQKQKQKQNTKEETARKKEESERNSLIELVENTHKQCEFIDCHKNMLINLIKDSKSSVNKIINEQVQKIKNEKSSINSLQEKIQKRQTLLKEMKQKKQKSQQIKQQSYKEFQMSTLAVIEQILVWKQDWQNTYHNVTKIKTKLTYGENGKNFILSLGDDCLKKDSEEADDPFLLRETTQQIDNQLIIRIRACELLLLQEKLHSQ